jgi:hypothetical protein
MTNKPDSSLQEIPGLHKAADDYFDNNASPSIYLSFKAGAEWAYNHLHPSTSPSESRIEKEQGEELTEDNTVELKHLNLLSAAVNDKDKLWAWERIAIYYQNKIQSLTAENTALQKVVSQVIAQNESLCEERDRYSVSWEEREKIMTGVEKERDEYRCMLGKILWANYVAPDSVKNILDKYPPK